MNYTNIRPKLTEPGVKYFLGGSLKQCNIKKAKYLNKVFNISIFLVFCISLGSFLTYRYKGKLTPYQINEKQKEKQKYVLSKIKEMKDIKEQQHQKLITGLPQWESEFDILHRQKYNI